MLGTHLTGNSIPVQVCYSRIADIYREKKPGYIFRDLLFFHNIILLPSYHGRRAPRRRVDEILLDVAYLMIIFQTVRVST